MLLFSDYDRAGHNNPCSYGQDRPAQAAAVHFILFESDARVEGASPVFSDGVVLLEGCNEMEDIGFPTK